jgi:hypothetical protein
MNSNRTFDPLYLPRLWFGLREPVSQEAYAATVLLEHHRGLRKSFPLLIAGFEVPTMAMEDHTVHEVQRLARLKIVAAGTVGWLKLPGLGLGAIADEVLDTKRIVSE